MLQKYVPASGGKGNSTRTRRLNVKLRKLQRKKKKDEELVKKLSENFVKSRKLYH